MPLQKIVLKPGVNRENTRYTNEGGYYESNLVRFRQGTPEKIGGWVQISPNTYVGICRSLWNWTTLANANLVGVGTEAKFYISQQTSNSTDNYYDVTPVISSHILTSSPISTIGQSAEVTVTDLTYHPYIGDYVIFSGMAPVTGITLNGQYQVTKVPSVNTYTVNANNVASGIAGTVTAGGGSLAYAAYLLNVANNSTNTIVAWGVDTWGSSSTTWGGVLGVGTSNTSTKLWTQYNFGENLLFGPKRGAMYFWNATTAPTLNSPTVVTVSNASPAVVTLTTNKSTPIPSGTALMLETTGALPTPFKPLTVYYASYITDTTFNLATSSIFSTTLSNVVITGTAGQFSCNASSVPLEVGQSVTISGGFNGTVALTGNRSIGNVGSVVSSGGGVTAALTSNTASGAVGAMIANGGTTLIPVGNSAFGAVSTMTSNITVALQGNVGIGLVNTVTTGSISGYVSPSKYYIVATNGSTTFTLSTTVGGSGVTTTPGTVPDLTFTQSTFINTTSAGSGTQTISIRAVPVSSLSGASDVPLTQNTLIVSDASRFTLVFGSNDYGSTTYDPLLVRWSDQESVTNWTPAITNQSGSLRLSHGSAIQAVLQSRQEILVFTDAAMYSLQYLGPPYVWGSQILSDNISIVSINAAAYSNGVAYWMGQDKFYKYDGRVQTLRCDLLRFVYNDINRDEFGQIFASTNEGFNEIWWFYCTANSNTVNRYIVYNYTEDVWCYGTMARTAWLDSSLRRYPLAATYSNNLVYHEYGVNDCTDSVSGVAMESSITTSQFDIGDGHNFAFVWRMLPDLTFNGSTDGTTPSLTIQLQPLQNSGSGYNSPESVGGTSSTATQTVAATYTYPQDPDLFTGQLNIRVRGRQMSMRIACNTLGTQWQLGAPRIDIRPDGRR
jgi:hypothetical protein